MATTICNQIIPVRNDRITYLTRYFYGICDRFGSYRRIVHASSLQGVRNSNTYCRGVYRAINLYVAYEAVKNAFKEYSHFFARSLVIAT